MIEIIDTVREKLINGWFYTQYFWHSVYLSTRLSARENPELVPGDLRPFLRSF
jgi:hypothetical protein